MYKFKGAPTSVYSITEIFRGGSKRHRPALETSCFQGEASWHRLRLESEMRSRIGVRKPEGSDLPSQRMPLMWPMKGLRDKAGRKCDLRPGCGWGKLRAFLYRLMCLLPPWGAPWQPHPEQHKALMSWWLLKLPLITASLTAPLSYCLNPIPSPLEPHQLPLNLMPLTRSVCNYCYKAKRWFIWL